MAPSTSSPSEVTSGSVGAPASTSSLYGALAVQDIVEISDDTSGPDSDARSRQSVRQRGSMRSRSYNPVRRPPGSASRDQPHGSPPPASSTRRHVPSPRRAPLALTATAHVPKREGSQRPALATLASSMVNGAGEGSQGSAQAYLSSNTSEGPKGGC